MARPLRVEFPGACYHVMSRGNFRFPVFEEEQDREFFLARFTDFADRFGVKIRAYGIMINHWHGYVQTTEANLSRFMQSLLTSFTVSYNRLHQTSGHVFQGRYKAFLVEDTDTYRNRVSAYIHLNPARVETTQGMDLATRQRVVREFRWGSYASIVGLRVCPRWLDREAVLAGFRGTLREKQRGYASLVEGSLAGAEDWDPHDAAAAQTVIGGDSFIDRIRRGLTSLSEKVAVRRECRAQATLMAWCGIDELIDAVSAAYDCEREELLRPWKRCSEPRQVLLYLAAEKCRGRYSLTEIAEQVGPISVSGLAKARQLMSARLERDRALSRRVKRLIQELTVISSS